MRRAGREGAAFVLRRLLVTPISTISAAADRRNGSSSDERDNPHHSGLGGIEHRFAHVGSTLPIRHPCIGEIPVENKRLLDRKAACGERGLTGGALELRMSSHLMRFSMKEVSLFVEGNGMPTEVVER